MLTKTNRTMSALITPTTPDAAFCTVVLTSAMPIPPWFGFKGKKFYPINYPKVETGFMWNYVPIIFLNQIY